jgi:predicted RNA binding protein YcfA (HicA-like mRNA interferase family)
MPRITSIHWKILECIFQQDGFSLYRQEGSHRVYVKKGFTRPIVIPAHKSVGLDVINSNRRSAKMSREKYLHLLEICKNKI